MPIMKKHTLLYLTLSFLVSFPCTAQLREPLPVPDIPGFRTLKCDFHMHTVVSDGEVWPTTRVQEAWRDGLDAIAITDHSDYNPHKDDIKADIARVYQLAAPLAARLGIVLIPAIEVAEKDIHFNALFVKDPAALQGKSLIEALEKARAQDAFVFWNHPGWKQTAAWFPPIAEAYDKKLFQGIELVNGQDFYPEAFPWIEERKLSILADSDAHQPLPPAQPDTVRTITLVFARTRDAAGIREALNERRTAAWMGGQVWGRESDLRGLWESGIKLDAPESGIRPGGPPAGIRLRNESSIPLKLLLRKAPEWIRGFNGELQLPGRSIMAGALVVAKNAPVGKQQVELEMEVTNFHVAPGKNLVVRLPLTIEIAP
jgi:3',5'-nucleoside bisphosphate phosphatase